MSSFDLRDIRMAFTISQYESLRQAADALHIRQSTLSRRLSEFEYRLGAPLFERTKRGTHPTSEGREFLLIARRLIDETDIALSKLRLHRKGNSGGLTLGTYTAFSIGNLHATLADFRHRFPEINLHLVDGARQRLLSDLAIGDIDLAIVTSKGTSWPDKSMPLWSERVAIALPTDSPLRDRAIIRWEDISLEKLLLNQRDPGLEFQNLALTRIHDNPQASSRIQEIGLDRLLTLVGLGYGMTLVLEGATGATYEGVSYRQIYDDYGPTRVDFIACWRHSNGNPTLLSFLDILQERYPNTLALDSTSDKFPERKPDFT